MNALKLTSKLGKVGVATVASQIPPSAFRPADAARFVGIGRSSIYELIRARRLRAVKLDGATLILRVDLEKFLASLPAVEGDREAMATP